MTIHHSKFSVSHLDVQRGERVRFVVRNTDPIDHELIVGGMPVQVRHETGREGHHGARDGEVERSALADGVDGVHVRRAGGRVVRVSPPRTLALRDARDDRGPLSCRAQLLALVERVPA